MADITERSLGGAHDDNIVCMAGKVTPPPMPSPTLIITTAHGPIAAAGGVSRVQSTLRKTEKNITHLALNRSATHAPGACDTKYPQK